MHNVLVISHNSFSKVFNNGKTLEAIFAQYSKANLAQLFFSQNEEPDFDFCSNFFKITDLDVLKNSFLNNSGGALETKNSNYTENRNTENRNTENKFVNTLKQKSSLNFFRDILWASNNWKIDKLYSWIEDFNPTIIFFMGGNLKFSHRIALHIRKKYNIPLVVFFTDDYLLYPLSLNLIDKLQKFLLLKTYKKTINASSLRFVIGDEMAREYTAFFGKEFIPIMNSVEIKDIPNNKNKESTLRKVVIRYFGGLHLDRWKMLCRLGKIINDINKAKETSISLEVFSASQLSIEMSKAFANSSILYKGKVFGEDLKNMMSNSDFLIHVESDDQYYRSLTRLSVSTKIPEYLITGIPTIGYGPSEVASIKLLSDNNLGFVIDAKLSDDEIKKELLTIIFNSNSTNILINAREFVKEKFDKNKTSKEFRNKMENI